VKVEKVLIVAKTHMNNAACVGGLTRDTNRSIRLLRLDCSNQPINTNFDVGQVWELDYYPSPHVEDIIVTRERYIGLQPNLQKILMQRIQPWQGGPEQLLMDCLSSRIRVATFLRPEEYQNKVRVTGFQIGHLL
jgi:hypothetical protein